MIRAISIFQIKSKKSEVSIKAINSSDSYDSLESQIQNFLIQDVEFYSPTGDINYNKLKAFIAKFSYQKDRICYFDYFDREKFKCYVYKNRFLYCIVADLNCKRDYISNYFITLDRNYKINSHKHIIRNLHSQFNSNNLVNFEIEFSEMVITENAIIPISPNNTECRKWILVISFFILSILLILIVFYN